MTNEIMSKIKGAKSADELFNIAKENGFDISLEKAEDMFKKFNTSGELSDEELASGVTGGKSGCDKVAVFDQCPLCHVKGHPMGVQHIYLSLPNNQKSPYTIDVETFRCNSHGKYGYDIDNNNHVGWIRNDMLVQYNEKPFNS